MCNHWDYKIYKDSYEGSRVLVAEYVAETTLESVKKDLVTEGSHLQGYLKLFFGIDAEEYARKFPLRAEALLGALIASMDCSVRFGMWLPVSAPPALHVKAPSELGPPVRNENGVRLWIRETAGCARGDASLDPI